MPSAPVPPSTRVSFSGSTPGPSRTTRPVDLRATGSRAAATASDRLAEERLTVTARAALGRRRCSRGSRPAGLVVCVASTPASSRAGSMRSVRARTSAAWLHAGSVLWALTTIASAPSCRACRGSAGWKPKCAAQAASTTKRDPVRMRDFGQPGDVADRPDVGGVGHEHRPGVGGRRERLGHGATAPRRAAGRSPGPPRDAPTPAAARRGPGRAASTGAGSGPPRPGRRLRPRPGPGPAPGCAWVAPPTEKRHTSAPHSRAARDSASASTPRESFIVSSPA